MKYLTLNLCGMYIAIEGNSVCRLINLKYWFKMKRKIVIFTGHPGYGKVFILWNGLLKKMVYFIKIEKQLVYMSQCGKTFTGSSLDHFPFPPGHSKMTVFSSHVPESWPMACQQQWCMPSNPHTCVPPFTFLIF